MTRRLANAFLVCLIIINFGLFTIFFNSQKPIIQEEKQLMTMAREDIGLKNMGKFYVLNKDHTTYTIQGENDQGELIYYAYQPDTNKKITGKVNELVNEQEAKSLTLNNVSTQEVKEARIGIEDDQLVWEVSFINQDGHLGYHYINAASGHWYETIDKL